VIAQKDGFAVNKVTDVPVLVGQIATINATLKPGTLHDEVSVTSRAVMIDQVSSSLAMLPDLRRFWSFPLTAALTRC